MLKDTFLRFGYWSSPSRFQKLTAGTSVNDKQQKVLLFSSALTAHWETAIYVLPNATLDIVQNNFRMRKASSSYSCLSRLFTSFTCLALQNFTKPWAISVPWLYFAIRAKVCLFVWWIGHLLTSSGILSPRVSTNEGRTDSPLQLAQATLHSSLLPHCFAKAAVMSRL
jgi:hypothetical protein